MYFLMWILLALSGCGGGGATSSTKPNSPSLPTEPQPNEPAQCVNQLYSISAISDNGNASEGFDAQKAIDGDTSSISRWSSTGLNSQLIIDVGSIKTIGSLTIKWFQGAEKVAYFSVDGSSDSESWTSLVANTQSSGRHSGFELIEMPDDTRARYIRLNAMGNNKDQQNDIVEVQVHQCKEATGQFNAVFPNEVGIELDDWYLSVPTDEDNSGTADSILETQLADGYTNSEYFYASNDNGIVMRSSSYGFKTSANTSYVRVELREMLRRGNRAIKTQGVNLNNWVFGSAPESSRNSAGGVDGDLTVKLAINHVTTSGEDYQVGRVVIGQIHANDDEPVRLYYRKLPGNDKGSVYFAHESREKDANGKNIESYIELIGSRSNSVANPQDGIALNEVFSYHINVTMNLLSVTVSREGKPDVVAQFDMSESLYNQADQYHYFKVGLYHLNNSSDPDDYVQGTFYQIKNSHNGYVASE
ncbi:polysaccharide lyase family 7 protein [Neptunicella marina]|uniref:Polysaccharide lyase family 7 protein n=2 Tax=Neptunicella marina TaxID=2125989 RepID=A0A8J6M438_9ALTE|nr:polysaccharide lyase family 7 protein [Neptunicella marina]MBC3765801.1 polysaccharide lyase family 7 protein [Neptunicella marina]